MVIPGGISEMLTQSPSNSRRGIVPVIRRTGFIRAALRHGVPLVPIFGANVNEMYAVAIYRWQAFRDLVGMFPLMCAAPPSRHCDPHTHTHTAVDKHHHHHHHHRHQQQRRWLRLTRSLGLVPRIWGSYSVAMPNPVPVTFVSGTPIEVPRKPDATEAEVAALAERFYRELAAVAERHAAESEEHAHLRLEFVQPGGSGGSKAE